MLNKQKGNMYEFIDATWNTVKGECPHGCSYCYMKSWGKQKPLHFDEKELKTNLGKDNFIFVGSSCDMFANIIPEEWILKTLKHCELADNKYLFQTKNPDRFWGFIDACIVPENKSVLCTTIETNRWYPEIMRDSPHPYDRAIAMHEISKVIETCVTIEPILDFDLDKFVKILIETNPTWINIGADSQGHNLPEPSPEKVKQLIEALQFTNIKIKKNLRRLND